jgi:DNA-binding winged helix-turn-helix (wHTH) protein
MGDRAEVSGSIRFPPFELVLEPEELRRNGMRVKVSGQALQVLIVLASEPGRLVTREHLHKVLWPATSFGDFEHGLNAAVNRLREILGDSAANPKYIETIRGKVIDLSPRWRSKTSRLRRCRILLRLKLRDDRQSSLLESGGLHWPSLHVSSLAWYTFDLKRGLKKRRDCRRCSVSRLFRLRHCPGMWSHLPFPRMGARSHSGGTVRRMVQDSISM